MKAVVTTGNGGYDKLVYRDVPVPRIGAGEVLLQVLAAGVNNTEINTRLGWYSSSVSGATNEIAEEAGDAARPDGGWNAATPFPFIQGTDCCGRVVEVADDVPDRLMGRRVLVRACMRISGFESYDNRWMASDFDGAFAQFVKVPAEEVFVVECNWTDEELATIPCAYATAENMLHRARVSAADHVLVTGASGGVGSAAVQLAKRRGARVTAVAGSQKLDAVRALGADATVAREDSLLEAVGEQTINVAIDNVAGPGFEQVIASLKRGGRYATSGAIAGPLVSLDLRTLYLNDLTFFGTTAWDEPVFPNLVRYVEHNEIRPLLAGSFPLAEIVTAQKAFLKKQHVGKFVLAVPPIETV